MPTLVHAHAASLDELQKMLGSSLSRGLDAAEAARRLAQHGRNELAQPPSAGWWTRLLRQFADLLVLILVAAAIVSGLLNDWVDAGVILAIVVLNGVLGFLQEARAERALAALKQLSSPQCKVIRDGHLAIIDATELVPGDVIVLEAGDRVPADGRLARTAELQTQESVLTGESLPVDKSAHATSSADAPLAERQNMVFRGTIVTAGSATALVTATGMRTELGRIAGLLEMQPRESTPLERRLNELGRTLIWVVLAVVGVIFAMQLARGGRLVEVLLLSISLAVAAVPEGLPAVVTIALALGVQRMAKRRALVRRLPSVETLGAVTVICSDKTGTLTRNEMTVQQIYADERWYSVSGVGYIPEGEFRDESGSEVDAEEEPGLRQFLHTAAWCCHAQVQRDSTTGEWTVAGDPTEGALVVAAMKAQLAHANRQHELIHEKPFESQRKRMSVVARDHEGRSTMHVKGAPEAVLSRCTREYFQGGERTLTDSRRREVLAAAERMGEQALRVLAVAYRDAPEPEGFAEEDLIFAGLGGMIDPPREEAKAAVAICRSAGIRPVMITGDHPVTARAIGSMIGLIQPGDELLTGSELNEVTNAGLAQKVASTSIYARVSAQHKLRVINAWRSRGDVVAMTGDGVNDAPALKAADIGIAMGITGTDVTKEASDMVLLDDNFVSIVNAVEEGRTIFGNIQKFIHYLLATNAGEVLLMFAAAVAGLPPPLFPIQILWINLVTDALPALAIGVEPAEPDVMDRPPREPREPVISMRRGLMILYHGTLVAAAAMLAFLITYNGADTELHRARTVAFCTIAYAQLFLSFGCRSQRYTLPQLGVFTNPWLIGAITFSSLLQAGLIAVPLVREVFEVAPLMGADWLLIAILSLLPVTFIEVAKLLHVPRVHPVAG
jgi:Ca2+-transporting ATPase